METAFKEAIEKIREQEQPWTVLIYVTKEYARILPVLAKYYNDLKDPKLLSTRSAILLSNFGIPKLNLLTDLKYDAVKFLKVAENDDNELVKLIASLVSSYIDESQVMADIPAMMKASTVFANNVQTLKDNLLDKDLKFISDDIPYLNQSVVDNFTFPSGKKLVLKDDIQLDIKPEFQIPSEEERLKKYKRKVEFAAPPSVLSRNNTISLSSSSRKVGLPPSRVVKKTGKPAIINTARRTSGSSAAPGSSVTPKWAKKSTINFMEVDEVQDINNQQATLKQKEEEEKERKLKAKQQLEDERKARKLKQEAEKEERRKQAEKRKAEKLEEKLQQQEEKAREKAMHDSIQSPKKRKDSSNSQGSPHKKQRTSSSGQPSAESSPVSASLPNTTANSSSASLAASPASPGTSTTIFNESNVLEEEDRKLILDFVSGNYTKRAEKKKLKLNVNKYSEPGNILVTETLYLELDYEGCRWKKIRAKSRAVYVE